MDADKKDKIAARARKALEAAQRISSHSKWQVESRVNEIQIHLLLEV